MKRAVFSFAAALFFTAPAFADTGYDATIKAYINVAQQRALARAALQSHGISKDTGKGPEVDLRIVFPPAQNGIENLEGAALIPVDGRTHQADGLIIRLGGTTVGVTYQPFKDVRPGETYDVVVDDAAHNKYFVGRVTITSGNPQTHVIQAPLLGSRTQAYKGPSGTTSARLEPWMVGFQGVTITPDLLKAAGYPNVNVHGVVIVQVVPGTAAQRAGLRDGDIIVGANRYRILTMQQFNMVTKSRQQGAATALIFFHNGRLYNVTVPVNGSQDWRPPSIGPGYVRPTSHP